MVTQGNFNAAVQADRAARALAIIAGAGLLLLKMLTGGKRR